MIVDLSNRNGTANWWICWRAWWTSRCFWNFTSFCCHCRRFFSSPGSSCLTFISLNTWCETVIPNRMVLICWALSALQIRLEWWDQVVYDYFCTIGIFVVNHFLFSLQIALGWAGDQPWMNVSKTYTWCLIACGIATILMSVFTDKYVLLMITSAAFGLFFASNFSFTPVILVELIPLERFTTAYGLSLLCQGIGNLLGPPLAGFLFDVTGSWNLSFLMAGGWIILSGLLMGIIPYTKNRKIWGSGPVEMERDRDCEA